MVKLQANFRLDENLLDSLKSRASADGVSTTDIVAQALQLFLNGDIQPAIQYDSNLDERIAACIESRISPLLTRLEALEVSTSDATANLRASLNDELRDIKQAIATITSEARLPAKKSQKVAA